MFNFLVILTVLVLLGVIGWHAFLLLFGGAALIGGAAIMAGGVWGWLVISVALICGAILAIFLFAGMAVLWLMLIIGFWTILAIVLFPIFLPILLPLLLIFMLIFYVRRRSINKESK